MACEFFSFFNLGAVRDPISDFHPPQMLGKSQDVGSQHRAAMSVAAAASQSLQQEAEPVSGIHTKSWYSNMLSEHLNH